MNKLLVLVRWSLCNGLHKERTAVEELSVFDNKPVDDSAAFWSCRTMHYLVGRSPTLASVLAEGRVSSLYQDLYTSEVVVSSREDRRPCFIYRKRMFPICNQCRVSRGAGGAKAPGPTRAGAHSALHTAGP